MKTKKQKERALMIKAVLLAVLVVELTPSVIYLCKIGISGIL